MGRAAVRLHVALGAGEERVHRVPVQRQPWDSELAEGQLTPYSPSRCPADGSRCAAPAPDRSS